MSKKRPPFIPAPQKNNEDLQGFSELLDEVEKKESFKKKPPAQIEDYEIFNYLEKENQRLESLDKFYSIKIKTQQDYPQIGQLISTQTQEKDALQEQLIDELAKEDSLFNIYLAEKFNKMFSN